MVGPDVMPNDGVGSCEVVAYQRKSIRRLEAIEQEDEKAISADIAFLAIRWLRQAARFQPANPWGPWSRRIAPFGPPAGS